MDVAKYLRKFELTEEDYIEAIQETFVEAYSLAHTLRDESKVKGWIIKIARTRGLRRKTKKTILTTLECVFKEDVVQLESIQHCEDDVLSTLVKMADRQILFDAVMRLKGKERNVLILQYIHGEKLKDIAVMVGESLTNTKTISRRARAKLKEYLIDGGYENGR